MKQLILDIHLQSKQIYGAPKLEKMGIKIAEKTVGNYMKEMGIKAHYIKPYTRTTIDPDFDENLKNLLKEQFNPEKPNAVWCSDYPDKKVIPTYNRYARKSNQYKQNYRNNFLSFILIRRASWEYHRLRRRRQIPEFF